MSNWICTPTGAVIVTVAFVVVAELLLQPVPAPAVPVPWFVRRRIQHNINPVLDTKQMGIGGKLTSVEISNGEVKLTGTADVNKSIGKG